MANSALRLVSCSDFLRPWRWRRHASPNRRLTFNGLHGVLSQETELFIITAVRTSNPTCLTKLLFIIATQVLAIRSNSSLCRHMLTLNVQVLHTQPHNLTLCSANVNRFSYWTSLWPFQQITNTQSITTMYELHTGILICFLQCNVLFYMYDCFMKVLKFLNLCTIMKNKFSYWFSYYYIPLRIIL
jgi:hypothetical protein